MRARVPVWARVRAPGVGRPCHLYMRVGTALEGDDCVGEKMNDEEEDSGISVSGVCADVGRPYLHGSAVGSRP